jgi:hypothetical protein
LTPAGRVGWISGANSACGCRQTRPRVGRDNVAGVLKAGLLAHRQRVHVGADQRRCASVISALSASGCEYAADVPDSVATNIIVFGRGLIRHNVGYRLADASAARVDALLNYIDQNKQIFADRRGTVVFSGGWAGAGQNLEKPPKQFREGSLMLNRAMAANIAGGALSEYAETFAEIESDSTLENLLRIVEADYCRDITFTPRNPLGLVAHKEHLNRIDYLARKVFNLPRRVVVQIVAPGIDKTSSGIPESLILPVTRLAFAGTSGADSLRRRQRLLIALHRTLPRRTRQPSSLTTH